MLFLGGVQLMSIGVLGRYLAHVHDQVLERPLYLVSRVAGDGASRPTRSTSSGSDPAPGLVISRGSGS